MSSFYVYDYRKDLGTYVDQIVHQLGQLYRTEKQEVKTRDTSENEKIENNLHKISEFKKLPKYRQKSQGWLDQRNNYLTASTIAAALGFSGKKAKYDLLVSKCSNGRVTGFTGNKATHWGNKYEPVANMIYSYRNNGIEIHEFGMITNPKYPILGVSPDGITMHRLIEIKCPSSRVIDGKIKKEYYHQMQEQMTVCDFDECDFIECKFEEVTEEQFWGDFEYYDPSENVNREKGVIIYYLDLTDSDEPMVEYLYSPVEYHDDHHKLSSWVTQTTESLSASSDKIYLGQLFWYLKVYSCQLVKRDPKWITTYYPVLVKFWEEVEHYRKIGYERIPSPFDDIIEEEEPSTPKSISISHYFKAPITDSENPSQVPLKIFPKVSKTKSRCLL